MASPPTRKVTIHGKALAAPLLLLGLAGSAVLAAAPQVVGIAAAIVNDVRIKGAATPQFRPAAERQRVAMADQVQTGRASRLQLLLLDKSRFTVGANARLTIDRFVYDPSGGSLSASVAKGAFRFMSGRTGGRKDATIRSPAATIGIRGTLLDGVVGPLAVMIARGQRDIPSNTRADPETATLVVLRGPGPRTQGNVSAGAVDVSAGGKTVTLDRPLLAAYVPYVGAQPIGPFAISLPGVAQLNDLLLDPREVLYDPGAPGQPYTPLPGRERPYYDGPPPGYEDGPGPRSPSAGVPGIPGLNTFPTRPDRAPPPRPSRQAPATTVPPQTPSTSPPAPPAPQSVPAPAPAPTSTPPPAPAPTPSPTAPPPPAPSSAPSSTPNSNPNQTPSTNQGPVVN